MKLGSHTSIKYIIFRYLLYCRRYCCEYDMVLYIPAGEEGETKKSPFLFTSGNGW